jgi:hypothetical protein
MTTTDFLLFNIFGTLLPLVSLLLSVLLIVSVARALLHPAAAAAGASEGKNSSPREASPASLYEHAAAVSARTDGLTAQRGRISTALGRPHTASSPYAAA